MKAENNGLKEIASNAKVTTTTTGFVIRVHSTRGDYSSTDSANVSWLAIGG